MGKRGNKEGSIYKRKDGRWTATIDLGWQDGKRKRKSFYGQTREEVARRLTEALGARKDGLPLASDRLTVAGFAREWLESVSPSIRPSTYQSYEAGLRVHILPELGNKRLSSLEPRHIEALYAKLSSRGYSPKSIRIYHSVIYSMLEKAIRWGVMPRNVARLVDLPRQVHRELPMLTPEEARAFLEAAKENRLEALFVLAITTAARQGELLGLTWDRVDLDGCTINVRQALQRLNGQYQIVETKTPQSMRSIALTSMAVASLRRHLERQEMEKNQLGSAWNNNLNLVFTTHVGTPLDRNNVRRRELQSVLKWAGLPLHLRFHDLRHITASLALAQGMPVTAVSEMLGHTDAATTLRVYAHAIPGAPRKVADALEAVLQVQN